MFNTTGPYSNMKLKGYPFKLVTQRGLLYVVASCRRGHARLNSLDLITPYKYYVIRLFLGVKGVKPVFLVKLYYLEKKTTLKY